MRTRTFVIETLVSLLAVFFIAIPYPVQSEEPSKPDGESEQADAGDAEQLCRPAKARQGHHSGAAFNGLKVLVQENHAAPSPRYAASSTTPAAL